MASPALFFAALVLALLSLQAEAGGWKKCYKYGGVCGDPALVGGDGVQFYFHGHKDADFCLVSDRNLHINAHFIGKRGEKMRRDFTWVQSLGILFGSHQLYIGANKVSSWDNAVDQFTLAFDASPVVLPVGAGSSWSSAYDGVSISRGEEGTNFLTVEVEGRFRLQARVVPVSQEENLVHNYGVTADDCFAHLELSFDFAALSPGVAGVLGQTYRRDFAHSEALKPGQSMRTMHGTHLYRSSALMSADCSVSRFGGIDAAAGSASEEILHNLPQLSCSTAGTGLVCRR